MPVIEVDWSSSEAIYEQIARQIRSRIIAGDLPPGQGLPTVRRLSSDLGVSLNTVARAYRILEEDGFLRIRERAGAIVADPAPRASAAVRASFRAELQDLVGRMRQAGVGPEEIRKLLVQEVGNSETVHRRGGD